MTFVMRVFAGVFLLIGSIYDAKKQVLPVWFLVAAGCGCLAGTCLIFFENGIHCRDVLWPLVPGCISLLLSFVTREQLGYGDGIVLLILGGCLGTKKVIAVWVLGLFGTFVASMVLLVLRKVNKNSRLPFVPFLLAGYVLMEMQGVLP